jgi:hypothetical protein
MSAPVTVMPRSPFRLALAFAAALPASVSLAQAYPAPQAAPATTPAPPIVPPAAAPAPPAAPPATLPPALEPPRWRVGATIGAGWAFGEQYFIAGASIGYRAVAGLELGLDANGWLGETPSILKLSPRLTYAVSVGSTTPYAGVYYARWMLGSGYSDADAVGGRVGVFQYAGRGGGFGVGVLYEHLLDCSGECGSWGPELMAAFSF